MESLLTVMTLVIVFDLLMFWVDESTRKKRLFFNSLLDNLTLLQTTRVDIGDYNDTERGEYSFYMDKHNVLVFHEKYKYYYYIHFSDAIHVENYKKFNNINVVAYAIEDDTLSLYYNFLYRKTSGHLIIKNPHPTIIAWVATNLPKGYLEMTFWGSYKLILV